MSSTSIFSKLSVVQLKSKLRSRGLTINGTKAELIGKLIESIAAEEKILNAVEADKSIDEDAVLNESEDVNEDEVLGLTSPTNLETEAKGDMLLEDADKNKSEWNCMKDERLVDKVNKNDSKNDEKTVDAKVRRALRFGLPLSEETLKQNGGERFGLPSTASLVPDDEKKRLRAVRFGVADLNNNSNDKNKVDLLQKRALRFGLERRKESGSIGQVDPPSFEVLAKRAKRFGTMTEKTEMIIKMQKRADRFGKN